MTPRFFLCFPRFILIPWFLITESRLDRKAWINCSGNLTIHLCLPKIKSTLPTVYRPTVSYKHRLHTCRWYQINIQYVMAAYLNDILVVGKPIVHQNIRICRSVNHLIYSSTNKMLFNELFLINYGFATRNSSSKFRV